MFGIGPFELLIVAAAAVGVPAGLYFLIRAAVRSGNRPRRRTGASCGCCIFFVGPTV